MGRTEHSWEVVVVGSGPAGSATAALLAEGGARVLLVDRAHFPRAKACAEYLSPGAEPILARLGLGLGLGELPGRRLRGMDLKAPGGHTFRVAYRSEGVERFAQAVPRAEFDLALLNAARQRGVEVWEGFRVEEVARQGGGVTGVVGRDEDGATVAVEARLVVGADGLNSVVARRLGLARRRAWPRRLGLVAHLGGVTWPEDVGQMHVSREGYVGVAPVGEDVVSVGLVVSLPAGGARMGSADAAFWSGLAVYPTLTERLCGGRLLHPVQGVGPLARRARFTAGPGFVLVGDAAGFLDPFTGEGLFRALRGAEVAARVAGAALRERPSGSVNVARVYRRARRRAFDAKLRLTWLIQVFVHAPPLLDYALARLTRRPDLGATFGAVLGDLAPPEQVLNGRFLARLLRP